MRRPRPSSCAPSRPVRLTAVLAAGSVLLSGCVAGSHTTRSTLGAATVAPSTTATASLPTDRASLAGSTQDPNAQPIPSGEGVPGTDFGEELRATIAARGAVRMTMWTAAGEATARVDPAARAAEVQVTSDGRAVTMVTLGGRTWVKGAGTVDVQVPPTEPGAQPGEDTRHWLLLDPGGADDISRRLGAQARLAETVSPGRFTTMLEGLLGDRTPRGEGSQVVFSVPPTQYLDAVGAPAALRSAVTRPVHLVVVLDGRGVPTSVTATVPTAEGDVTDRTEYSRWGQPVGIEAPPEDDVAPAPGSPAQATATPTPTVSDDPSRTSEPRPSTTRVEGDAGPSTPATSSRAPSASSIGR